MRTINIIDWRGHRDASPLDPALMQFAARPAKSCRGCIYEGQYADVCQLAGNQARLRGIPDCEDGAGFIYTAVAADARQVPLVLA